MKQELIFISGKMIDKRIKKISSKLYGKDKDLIYSNAKTEDFIKGLSKEGKFSLYEDKDYLKVEFEKPEWFEGKKIVEIRCNKPGKRAKMKRLAITLVCSLIVKDYTT